jgi:prevent-host-death family protein
MEDVVASRVSVRDLKTHLSEWLARAQAGEVVEVTSHRRPIARLTGIKQPRTTPANPLQAAIDAGIVSWNGQKPLFPPPLRLSDGGKSVSEIVLEDRG